MPTHRVVVSGTVDQNGTLRVRDRVKLPPGEVVATIRSLAEFPSRTGHSMWDVLEDVWREQHPDGCKCVTREEFCAEIAAFRREAEEAIRHIEELGPDEA